MTLYQIWALGSRNEITACTSRPQNLESIETEKQINLQNKESEESEEIKNWGYRL